MINSTRFIFIDHARGFLFLLMAIDHSLHAYAEKWKNFWFFRDYESSSFFDHMYLFNQAIIMPGIFFIMGLFIINSFEKRKLGGFIKEKLIRLGIPFVIFIPLTVPLLSFPRYETYEHPGISYFDFFTNIFFSDRLQAGPLWVMQAMFFYGLFTVLIYKLFPLFLKITIIFFNWIRNNPILGISTFILISFLLLTLCDLRWGAPWWIKLFGFLTIDGSDIWNKFIGLFSIQASRFLMLFWFTLSGTAVMKLGWLSDKEFMASFIKKTPLWICGMIVFGIIYTNFSMNFYNDGAYNETIREFLYNNGNLSEIPFLII